MGKALVIKNANFYNNRIKTIAFDDIPCTGISLSDQSISVTGETTITATVTPADTTDAILWTSSDETIATVNNGIITPLANGTAIITATCGNYSASCEATVSIPFKASKLGLIVVNTTNSGTQLLPYAKKTASSRNISFGTTEGGYPALGLAGDMDMGDIYPYPIPAGAKTITVSGGDNLAPLIVYYNRLEKARPVGSPDFAQDPATVIDGQTAASGTQWSISGWTYGENTFTIPDIPGINSFTIGFYTKTAAAWESFDVNNPNITLSFGY